MKYPNLFIVGAAKSGTTTIYSYLTPNLQAIGVLGHVSPHGGEVVGNHGETVRLLDAQFGGVLDHRRALGERAGHGQDRQFVDHVGNFGPADDGAPQEVAHNLDFAVRLAGALLLLLLAEFGSHAEEHGEHAGARRVEAEVFDHQAGPGLRGGGHQPESGAGNIPRDVEIAGAGQ